MSTHRDKPWIFRTYAGHSSAQASNALYRSNLAKGQTGLSVAFDLPTQTGYDSDHPLAKGEVGKVGVPIGHLGDMRALFDGLPLAKMNTSMTINAPAAWLLALYIAVADEQGAPRAALQGTTQNDIIKEYLARGTYIFPPKPALRLTTDTIAFTTAELPKWNPINLCSYHLQEAGADAVEEAAFALAAAIAVLDAARTRNAIPSAEFSKAVGRISFFVNSGVKFITEICKLRAMAELWDEIARERYGVEPHQVPDFIALRGDLSDKLPGARGTGAKTAAALLRRFGNLEDLLATGRFVEEAEALKLYKRIATMDASAPLPALNDQTPTWDVAAALAQEWGMTRLVRRLQEMGTAGAAAATQQ